MITTNLRERIYTSIFLIFLLFFILLYDVILVYSLIVLGTFSVIEFFNIINKIIKKKLYGIIINISFYIYIFIFCILFFLLLNFSFFKITLLILLTGSISSDLGGYIFGKIFKGPKLTNISPNKTIAGAIGSIFLTYFSVSILFYYLMNISGYKILFLSLILSLTCQLGDLFFSILKRKAKIKDTGNILPGHGGILDRIDGILLSIPSGFLTLILIH